MGAAGAVGSGASASPSQGQAAPQTRAEWLVGHHQTAEEQAREYHRLHSRYQDVEGHASRGQMLEQLYQTNPQFRRAWDDMAAGKFKYGEPEKPAAGPDEIFFDPGNEDARDQWWQGFVNNPRATMEKFAAHIQAQIDQKYGGKLSEYEQTIRRLQAEAHYRQFEPKYSAMGKDPYGQRLIHAIRQRQVSPEVAVQLWEASRPQGADALQDQANQAGAMRDATGRFARAQTGGRSSPSVVDDGKPMTAEKRAKLVRQMKTAA